MPSFEAMFAIFALLAAFGTAFSPEISEDEPEESNENEPEEQRIVASDADLGVLLDPVSL